MSFVLDHADAHTLARVLAEQLVNDAPWSDTGDVDSTDACGQVAEALEPTFEAVQEGLLAEVNVCLSQELAIKLSDFLGHHAAHYQDGGYLLGLAVGQFIHPPALAARKNGGAR